jgi:hypothetical protein
MGEWPHPICLDCWDARNPGRVPRRIVEAESEMCCFCGRRTTAGVYLRFDPSELLCGGKHGGLDGAHD